MRRRVAEEDARRGARGEFMGGSRRGVVIAKATENMEMRVSRRRPKQNLMRSKIVKSFSGQKINEVGHDMKSLSLVGGRKIGLKEERTHHVGDGADHALNVPILLGCVGTCETGDDATRGKERFEI